MTKTVTATAFSRRAALTIFGGLAAAAAFAPAASAAKLNITNNGVAIQGYDPVAYFTADQAIEGDSAFTADYDGATYQFSSAENRDIFAADPAKYVPAYGGFCAYAMAQGAIATINPKAYKVVDGTLYLNFSKGVQSRWENDVPGNIVKADANWPTLSQQ